MPHVKFRLNKKLDKQTALAFLSVKAGGVDFSNGIINVHEELKGIKLKNPAARKKTINSYFNYFYQKYDKYLHDQINKFQIEWDKKETHYLREIIKILGKVEYSGPI